MKKTLTALCMGTLSVLTVSAQTKKATGKETTKKDDGYKMSPNGMEYKIVYDEPGGQKPGIGDFIAAHLLMKVEDSTLFNTREVMNNQPAEVQMMAPPGKGDVMEGFTFMTAGDSAIFRFSVDSLMKIPGMQPLPWMKPGTGQKVYYYTKLAGVKSAADKQKEAQEAAAKQIGIDDKILQDYFAKNNIKPTKTASGLYYVASKMGNGPVAKSGERVRVNYTGKTLEGKVFDSNVDSAFQHVTPFEFTVGQGQVIKGWDEGFSIFKKGTKGTLYIPSTLAYGPNSPDPSRIPVNGILVFDVELLDVVSNTESAGDKKN